MQIPYYMNSASSLLLSRDTVRTLLLSNINNTNNGYVNKRIIISDIGRQLGLIIGSNNTNNISVDTEVTIKELCSKLATELSVVRAHLSAKDQLLFDRQWNANKSVSYLYNIF